MLYLLSVYNVRYSSIGVGALSSLGQWVRGPVMNCILFRLAWATAVWRRQSVRAVLSPPHLVNCCCWRAWDAFVSRWMRAIYVMITYLPCLLVVSFQLLIDTLHMRNAVRYFLRSLTTSARFHVPLCPTMDWPGMGNVACVPLLLAIFSKIYTHFAVACVQRWT